jgi:hypothetical protein
LTFQEKGRLDVHDGAFALVDKNGARVHIPVGGVDCLLVEPFPHADGDHSRRSSCDHGQPAVPRSGGHDQFGSDRQGVDDPLQADLIIRKQDRSQG